MKFMRISMMLILISTVIILILILPLIDNMPDKDEDIELEMMIHKKAYVDGCNLVIDKLNNRENFTKLDLENKFRQDSIEFRKYLKSLKE